MTRWQAASGGQRDGVPVLLFSAFPNTDWSFDQVLIDVSSEKVNRRRRTLLVVDDNPDARRLLGYMLEDSYDVASAAGVDEALHLAKDKAFDALLLDINLCEQRTGVDLLRELRKMAAYKDVPAVACTAYAGWRDRERLLAQGFDWYLAKPFKIAQLYYVLDQAFREGDD